MYFKHSLACMRNSRGKSPRISYGAKSLPPTAFGKLHEPFYTTVSRCTLTEYVLRSSCLSQIWSPKHNCYLSYNTCARSGCQSWLSFITVVIQAHPSLTAARASSCTKILLTLCMRPAATVLNYSVKNIRNEVQQKIYI